MPSIAQGSSTLLSYGDRLNTLLTEAGLALSGNRQAGLNQAKSALVQIGSAVEAGGFQAGMAGVLQGLYTLTSQPMTEAQAKQAGRTFAATLTTSDLPIATQVMQAKTAGSGVYHSSPAIVSADGGGRDSAISGAERFGSHLFGNPL